MNTQTTPISGGAPTPSHTDQQMPPPQQQPPMPPQFVLPPPPPITNQTVSLHTLVQQIVQRASSTITDDLRERLQDASPDEKKRQLWSYFVETREKFIRLLVALRWKEKLPHLQTCKALLEAVDTQSAAFESTANALYDTDSRIRDEWEPVYDIPTAIDVLTTGSYPRLPQSLQVVLKSGTDNILSKFTQDDWRKVVDRLTDVIRMTLLAETLPHNFAVKSIRDGRVTLFAKDEFEITLTLEGPTPSQFFWRILKLTIFVNEDHMSGSALTPYHNNRLVDALQRYLVHCPISSATPGTTSPLTYLYTNIHDVCVRLAMDIFGSQSHVLQSKRLRNVISADTTTENTLIIRYWKGAPAMDFDEAHNVFEVFASDGQTNYAGYMKIFIDERKDLVVQHQPTLSGLQSWHIKLSSLNLSVMVMKVIRTHINARLKFLGEHVMKHVNSPRLAPLFSVVTFIAQDKMEGSPEEITNDNIILIRLFLDPLNGTAYHLAVSIDWRTGRWNFALCTTQDETTNYSLLPTRNWLVNLEEQFNKDSKFILDALLLAKHRLLLDCYYHAGKHLLGLDCFYDNPGQFPAAGDDGSSKAPSDTAQEVATAQEQEERRFLSSKNSCVFFRFPQNSNIYLAIALIRQKPHAYLMITTNTGHRHHHHSQQRSAARVGSLLVNKPIIDKVIALDFDPKQLRPALDQKTIPQTHHNEDIKGKKKRTRHDDQEADLESTSATKKSHTTQLHITDAASFSTAATKSVTESSTFYRTLVRVMELSSGIVFTNRMVQQLTRARIPFRTAQPQADGNSTLVVDLHFGYLPAPLSVNIQAITGEDSVVSQSMRKYAWVARIQESTPSLAVIQPPALMQWSKKGTADEENLLNHITETSDGTISMFYGASQDLHHLVTDCEMIDNMTRLALQFQALKQNRSYKIVVLTHTQIIVEYGPGFAYRMRIRWNKLDKYILKLEPTHEMETFLERYLNAELNAERILMVLDRVSVPVLILRSELLGDTGVNSNNHLVQSKSYHWKFIPQSLFKMRLVYRKKYDFIVKFLSQTTISISSTTASTSNDAASAVAPDTTDAAATAAVTSSAQLFGEVNISNLRSKLAHLSSYISAIYLFDEIETRAKTPHILSIKRQVLSSNGDCMLTLQPISELAYSVLCTQREEPGVDHPFYKLQLSVKLLKEGTPSTQLTEAEVQQLTHLFDEYVDKTREKEKTRGFLVVMRLFIPLLKQALVLLQPYSKPGKALSCQVLLVVPMHSQLRFAARFKRNVDRTLPADHQDSSPSVQPITYDTATAAWSSLSFRPPPPGAPALEFNSTEVKIILRFTSTSDGNCSFVDIPVQYKYKENVITFWDGTTAPVLDPTTQGGPRLIQLVENMLSQFGSIEQLYNI